jgi:hypothetical protein
MERNDQVLYEAIQAGWVVYQMRINEDLMTNLVSTGL